MGEEIAREKPPKRGRFEGAVIGRAIKQQRVAWVLCLDS